MQNLETKLGTGTGRDSGKLGEQGLGLHRVGGEQSFPFLLSFPNILSVENLRGFLLQTHIWKWRAEGGRGRESCSSFPERSSFFERAGPPVSPWPQLSLYAWVLDLLIIHLDRFMVSKQLYVTISLVNRVWTELNICKRWVTDGCLEQSLNETFWKRAPRMWMVPFQGGIVSLPLSRAYF